MSVILNIILKLNCIVENVPSVLVNLIVIIPEIFLLSNASMTNTEKSLRNPME